MTGGWRTHCGCFFESRYTIHCNILPVSNSSKTSWVAYPFAVCAKGGPLWELAMPKGLKRITKFGHLHFITFCRYQRRALLGSGRATSFAGKGRVGRGAGAAE